MRNLVFMAFGFCVVGLLCIVIWFDHKRRERKRKKKGAPVIVMPYFNDEEKQRWIL